MSWSVHPRRAWLSAPSQMRGLGWSSSGRAKRWCRRRRDRCSPGARRTWARATCQGKAWTSCPRLTLSRRAVCWPRDPSQCRLPHAPPRMAATPARSKFAWTQTSLAIKWSERLLLSSVRRVEIILIYLRSASSTSKFWVHKCQINI